MTILELENLTGLDRATIRFYEKEGLINPSRRENSYRDYSAYDAQEVLKIKLLRQLDVPIETIRNLQQGSADISSVLRVQASALEDQITDKERAAAICKEISATEVTYKNLDATLYLNRLKEQPRHVQQQPPSTAPAQQPVQQPVQQYAYVEYHPIRRFVARMLDYSLLQMLVRFILIVILRIRPFGDFLSYVVEYGCLLASVPLQAWMLSTFTTTPGKWVMGIHVLSYRGRKLSFGDAMQREWIALCYGYGLGIPIISLLRLFKSYRTYTNREPLEEDFGVEHVYSRVKVGNKLVFAAFCAIILSVNLLVAMDSVRPKYRGNDLTVAQYAENFNFYSDMLDYGKSMNPDGTWYVSPQVQNGTTVVVELSKPEKSSEPFRFDTEGDRITRITYENAWQNVSMLTPMSNRMLTAMLTAIMSQNDVQITQLYVFLNSLEKYSDDTSASVQFENIEINWIIETENCTNYNGIFYAADQEKPSRLEFFFEIIIHMD